MALIKVGPKFQVTIPKVAREAIGLSVGDLVEATMTKEGVLLRPKVAVDKSSLAVL
jgi:AbrB family looped-hinge helix DNA binding protein